MEVITRWYKTASLNLRCVNPKDLPWSPHGSLLIGGGEKIYHNQSILFLVWCGSLLIYVFWLKTSFVPFCTCHSLTIVSADSIDLQYNSYCCRLIVISGLCMNSSMAFIDWIEYWIEYRASYCASSFHGQCMVCNQVTVFVSNVFTILKIKIKIKDKNEVKIIAMSPL